MSRVAVATKQSDLITSKGTSGLAEGGQWSSLEEKARRCRRLAAGVGDAQAAEVLRSLATDYEESAARLHRS